MSPSRSARPLNHRSYRENPLLDSGERAELRCRRKSRSILARRDRRRRSLILHRRGSARRDPARASSRRSRLERTATPRNQAIVGEMYAHFSKIHFKSGRGSFIADEKIRNSERVWIQSPAHRNAAGAITSTTEILHGREKSRAQNLCDHAREASNCARVIARKRTRASARRAKPAVHAPDRKDEARSDRSHSNRPATPLGNPRSARHRWRLNRPGPVYAAWRVAELQAPVGDRRGKEIRP